MGNKTSVPAQEKQRVIAHKYSLFDHIPHESVLQYLVIETEHHSIHSVCIDVGGQVFVKNYKANTKQISVDLCGVADFPLFLIDPKKEQPSVTVMVSMETEEPLDVTIIPKFREVSPEEYSMTRHTNIEFPLGGKNSGLLIFKSKEKDGGLVIRSV